MTGEAPKRIYIWNKDGRATYGSEGRWYDRPGGNHTKPYVRAADYDEAAPTIRRSDCGAEGWFRKALDYKLEHDEWATENDYPYTAIATADQAIAKSKEQS